ncbi:MAG: alpha-L-fucosidase [Lentimonas sp.]
MKRILSIFTFTAFGSALISANAAAPTMPEVYAEREMPAWFNEDKFGIFVVWGPYSVPSYKARGYAEWYWKHSQNPKISKDFHDRVYGEDFTYEEFAPMFTAELWDPDFWCELFAKSGAKYVVTTANYHDGFAMYPTEYAQTTRTDVWDSTVIGPKRDIIGELNEAGAKHDLKMGIYYSLYEWYHPLWLKDREKFATEWLAPKFKEVVSKYKPWHIFLDGDWDMGWEKWRSNELAHWLYTESPVKDTVVVNDRWGGSRGKYGDVIESEFGGGKYTTPERPWQEDRGIGRSYGFNRAENIYNYDSREELLRMFSGVVGGGGNFLLCVGPTADGRIPVIMQERLLQIGEWLKVNGDAVYGTTASPFWPRQFDWGTVSSRPGKLYIHIHNSDLGELKIEGFAVDVKDAKLLQAKGGQPVDVASSSSSLSLTWNPLLNDKGVTVIELDVADDYSVDTTPYQYANGTIEFNLRAMEVHGDGAKVHYGGHGNRLFMKYWSNPEDYLTSEFIVNKPGKYRLTLLEAARNQWKKPIPEIGGRYKLEVGESSLEREVTMWEYSEKVHEVDAGIVNLNKGKNTFSLKPIDDGSWKGYLFQGIRLEPLSK